MKQKTYQVSTKDLPLSCPADGSATSGSHPKVYLKMNEAGEAVCQYCGAKYIMIAK